MNKKSAGKKGKVEYKAPRVDYKELPENSQEAPVKGFVMKEPEAVYMIGKVRDGLHFDEFHALQEMLGVTEERMGALLGMSRATLHRRKKTGHLDRVESDRLVRYARILSSANGLFRDNEAAARWLSRPAMAFNYEAPLDYADTEIGAREVEALLSRIEHGIPS